QRQLGNFPQAFSHIALVNTAYNVGHAAKPCEQRSGHKRIRASAKHSRRVQESAEVSSGAGGARSARSIGVAERQTCWTQAKLPACLVYDLNCKAEEGDASLLRRQSR